MSSLERSGELATGPDGLEEVSFRTHFERFPQPAYVWERDGDDFRMTNWNAAAEQVTGSNIGALLGITARDLYADQPGFAAAIRACADSGEVIEYEADHRCVGGLLRRLLVAYVPLSADRVVVYPRDMTDLRKSEARLHALFMAIPDIVFRMDTDARFLDVHIPDGLQCPFPWRREEIVGRSVADFYGEEAQRQQIESNRKAVETGTMQVLEVHLPAPNGLLHLESRVARAGDNEVVVAVRDITERGELEKRLNLLAERERNRLGSEIHDGLAQLLTGAQLMLKHTERNLQQADSPHAKEIGQAAELIAEGIAQARELVRGLSPIPEGTRLFGALRLLAKQAERYLGVPCETCLLGTDERIGEAAIANLYRIAQEAITNAVRHGKAASVELSCEITDLRLTLAVVDDGYGLPENLDGSDGLGLKIMRQRARSIGSVLRLERTAAGGTRMVCASSLLEALAD